MLRAWPASIRFGQYETKLTLIDIHEARLKLAAMLFHTESVQNPSPLDLAAGFGVRLYIEDAGRSDPHPGQRAPIPHARPKGSLIEAASDDCHKLSLTLLGARRA
jgi:hypothetical protein